ncbi:helix-turn-helix domain-containing protein [Bifidobacterium felsineum]|uniref:helix-turn-helix domain-containing protein n=1 Tax=Bifidobacterium felsineum TaxID=2045440 RepID=UPI001BDCAA62|nr:helix-turn-helix transcriptional regulator [Bifidobacterium felsineum]
MNPIELAARRRRLGLSREELGRCIGLVTPMPPIDRDTVAGWEEGSRMSDDMRLALPGILDLIEERTDLMCDRIRGLVEHSSAVRDDPTVTVTGYTDDETFWHDWPDLQGWPHILWNIAATVAIDEARDDYGIEAWLETR